MTKTIGSLQSLRFFAALEVFRFHLYKNYLGGSIILGGTDFFIVLVGMVAALTQAPHIPRGEWTRYIKGRYLRLYVTYVPIYFIYLIVGRDPVTYMFALKSFFFIPIEGNLPLVGPAWMLSQFLVFYFVFSIAFLFRTEKILAPLFAAWAALCLIHETVHGLPFDHTKLGEILFGIRNLQFLFGYAAGKLLASHRVSIGIARITLIVAVAILIPSTIWVNLTGESISRTFLFGIPVATICLALARLENERKPGPLLIAMTHPWLIWLGGTSYVLFLVHNMILRIWDSVFHITPVQVPLIMVTVVIAAAIGYQFWERPVLAYLRRKISPGPPSGSVISRPGIRTTAAL